MLSIIIINIVIILIVVIIIKYKNNEYYEKQIINLILTKLDFISKHYKIVKINNKYFIKCHYYSTEYFDMQMNLIPNKLSDFHGYNGKNQMFGNSFLPFGFESFNFDKEKQIHIIVADIIIDLFNKNYTINQTYFIISNINNDANNQYTNIINKLNDKDYYIQINNLYDINLKFICYMDENKFHPFSKTPEAIRGKTRFSLHNNTILDININLTNDNDNIIINCMFNQSGTFPDVKYGLSNTIYTKPHIYNDSFKINKNVGCFI
jgi:hypothetical protein